MPRIFTVTFTHRTKSYTAIVSQLSDSICVYLPDESLHHLLPYGRFSYSAEEELTNNTQPLSVRQQLLLDVVAAIKAQLQTTG